MGKAFLLILTRALGRSWKNPHVRILYFHGVPAEYAERFAEIVDHFSRLFAFEPYSRAVEYLKKGPIFRPTMVVTFDDADKSVFEVARPILEDRGILPCVFAVADYVEKGMTYRESKARSVMSWTELEKCLDSGWQVGNHTFSHPDVTKLSASELLDEVQKNRELILRRLGYDPVHFAYPYGQFNRFTVALLRDSGMCETQATTQRGQMGQGHDVHLIRRDRVDLNKTPSEIEALMRLADRFYWLRNLRRFMYALRGRL